MIHIHTSTAFGEGACLTLVYAGCGGDMPKPVPMVQHGGARVEKGWITVLLCRLLQAQCTYQEGLVSLAMNSGSIEKYGRHHTFFHDGFQEQILASKNGARVPAVHSFYCGKLGVLQVYQYAIWALQCLHDFSAPHAEHPRGTELDILHHLFR